MTQPKNYYEQKDHAKLYNQNTLIWLDGRKRVSQLDLHEDDTVLEIGPGPGVLTVDLSKKVKHVTAIEPSKAMISYLIENLKQENCLNVDIIEKRFEDVSEDQLQQYDVVIASYSLMMDDWTQSFTRMIQHAQKKVILYWFDHTPTWEKLRLDLYPKIYHKELKPMRKVDEIESILQTLDVTYQVEHLKDTHFSYIYKTKEDVMVNLYDRLNLLEQSEKVDQIFEQYYQDYFRLLEDGSYQFMDETPYVKIVIQHK